ncbi:MAG: phosphate ABC transporter substrate-binding protein PstS [Actinomycetes bacterium]
MSMQRRHRLVRIAAAAAVAGGLVASVGIAPAGAAKPKPLAAATINGSGSTFVQGYVDACRESFKKVQPNVTVNYPNPGGGSGKGRQEFADQVTQWGASDGAYPSADLAKVKGGTFLYIPTVTAPITVSFNVSGVKKLNLDAATIAKIFQGDITTWSDPAIAALNKGAKLPSTKITIVRRSDSSGTTQNFTTYLTLAAGSVWKLGSGSTVTWPDSSQGGAGNPGVSSAIKSTDGAIGYVDFSDAVATGLTYASVSNSTGKFIAPSVKAATAALDGVTLSADGLYNPLNSPNAAAYPISAPTWLLVYGKYADAAQGAAVKAWAQYLVSTCQKEATAIDYAPLPKKWASSTLARLAAIQ